MRILDLSRLFRLDCSMLLMTAAVFWKRIDVWSSSERGLVSMVMGEEGLGSVGRSGLEVNLTLCRESSSLLPPIGPASILVHVSVGQESGSW